MPINQSQLLNFKLPEVTGAIFNNLLNFLSFLIFLVIVIALLWKFDMYPFSRAYNKNLIIVKKFGSGIKTEFRLAKIINKIMDMKADIIEEWYVTKREHLIYPVFKAENRLSEEVEIMYRLDTNNVYPCAEPKLNIDIKKMRITEEWKLTDEWKVEELTGKDGKKLKAIIGAVGAIVFPEKVEIKPIIDNSVITKYVQLHKVNALKYTFKSWWERWGPAAMLGFGAFCMFIVLIVVLKYNDTIKAGVKVGVELAWKALPNIPQVPTSAPPPTTLPATPPPL